MGLGFSPLTYRLPAQQSSFHPLCSLKRHNCSSVKFVKRDRKSVVEDSTKRQQQSVLALLQQPRAGTMQLSAVNSRECTRPGRSRTATCKKSDCGKRSTMLARKLAALSQLTKTANSVNLRVFLPANPVVFSALQLATRLPI